ncbi:hypothetical protein LP414_06860 [Polaromonas sp. P1(28)-13]|nr:hypothetical protein LP414_06860 [Polaromonas sp. P1(28)-13]
MTNEALCQGVGCCFAGSQRPASQKFSAAEFVQALHDRSVSVMYVLPTMFKMMVDDPAFSPAC